MSLPRYEFHPIYGTFQKPNLTVRRYNPPNYDVTNRTNSLGFRDREDGFEEDLAGIWLAGASNSYGGFVRDDEIFSAKVQALGYKAANLSSEGHQLHKQVRVIRHLVQQGYRPRAVIIELTHNNNIGDYRQNIEEFSRPLNVNYIKVGDSKSAREKLMEKMEGLSVVADISPVSIKSRLIKNSAFYSWLKVGINSIPLLHELTLKWGLRADVALADSLPVGLLRDTPKSPKDDLIDSTADFIAATRDWVAANLDVPFGVILIPSQHHLDRNRFERYMRHMGLFSDNYDPTRPYRRSLQALRAHKIDVLDMAPAMTSKNVPLSFPDDGHTNATGHAIIAKELAKFLKSSLGLDPQ